jgi:hypothetical protein
MPSISHTFPAKELQKYTWSTYQYIPIHTVILIFTVTLDEEGEFDYSYTIRLTGRDGATICDIDACGLQREDHPHLWGADGLLCEIQDEDDLDLSKWQYKTKP